MTDAAKGDRTKTTVGGIMSLVNQYALARITRNASTPTRSSRGHALAEEWHQRDIDQCALLERQIREALIGAGVPLDIPAPPTESAERPPAPPAVPVTVRAGDVVYVPPGVDEVVTTAHRVLIERITGSYASGTRIKADGSPALNRYREPIQGLVPLSILPRCTITPRPEVGRG